MTGIVEGRSVTGSWSFEILVDRRAGNLVRQLAGTARLEVDAVVDALATAVCLEEIGHWRFCPYDSSWLARIVDGIAAGVAYAAGQVADPSATVRRLTGLFCDLVADTCVAAHAVGGGQQLVRAGHALRTLAIASTGRVPVDIGLVLLIEQWTVGGDGNDRLWTSARERLCAGLDPRLKRAARELARGLGLLSAGPMARGARAARLLGERSRWRQDAECFARACLAFPPVIDACIGIDVIGAFSNAHASISTEHRRRSRAASGREGAVAVDVLRLMYEARGTELAIEADRGILRSQTPVAIAWAAARPYGAGEPVSLSDVKLSATRLIPRSPGESALVLYRRQVPITTPVAMRRRAVPDIAWVVDSSASMEWTPLHGVEGGRFDRLLRTVFGVWRWLERHGLADSLRHAALNFSSKTLWSGWQPWANRRAVESVLFAHQGRQSRLDAQVALTGLLEARRRSIVIFVTDGEVDNADDVAAAFGELRRWGHCPILVEVGSEASALLERLAAAGFECHHTPEGAQLSGLTLGSVVPRCFGS